MINTTGNVIVSESAVMTSLETIQINDISLSEFMTISTDQTITANTMISRIISQGNIESKLFNNMRRFLDNVVLLGQDNTIECMIIK